MTPWARRRATRRALLTGGAGLAAAIVGGAAWERTRDATSPPLPIGDFYVGLNVSGIEDPIPAGPTPEMLDTYASYGVRRLRLPGRWAFFQPDPMGPLDKDYVAMYLGVVRDAAARGMTVVAEPCHDFGGRTIGKVEHKIGDGTLTSEMLADFWRRFVRATADTDAIEAWELMNEPGGLPGASRQDQSRLWAAIAQDSVDAIRDTGEDRVIKIDPYQPGSDTAWTTDNVALHTITDPLDHLVFSTHVYLDHDDSGRFPYWDTETGVGDTHGGGRPLTYDVGARRVQPFVAWLRKHNLVGEVGECGVGWRDNARVTSAAGWQIALDTTLRYCREAGLPVYAWGAGAHFGRPYELSLEPAGGLPAPQWEVLQRYLPQSDDASSIHASATPSTRIS